MQVMHVQLMCMKLFQLKLEIYSMLGIPSIGASRHSSHKNLPTTSSTYSAQSTHLTTPDFVVVVIYTCSKWEES